MDLEYSEEFLVKIMEIRTNSYRNQIGYLGKVFEMIDEKYDEKKIKGNLKKNEKTSLEWCMRFNVPISQNHFPLTVE